MYKYLIILDGDSGYAEIYNVAIIFADNEIIAKEKFIKIKSYADCVKSNLTALKIDDVKYDYFYYN